MHAEVVTRAAQPEEYRATFNDLAEFVDHVRTARQASCWPDRPVSQHRETSGHYGTNTFAQALALAESGWTGADERIAALGADLADKVASLVERPRWNLDVAGDALDVGLYLSGEPECWRTLTWEIAEGYGRRIFRVIVPTGATCMVPPDAYTWAGAAACAAVQAIEQAGHGAEVWAYNASDAGAPVRIGARVMIRIGARVQIKAPEYPLDLPRLAFVAANAAFHRRLIFRFRECAPLKYGRPMTFTYGRTSYHYLTEGEANDITLPTPMAVHGFMRAGGAKEGLLKWLRGRLAEAGIIRQRGRAARPARARRLGRPGRRRQAGQ